MCRAEVLGVTPVDQGVLTVLNSLTVHCANKASGCSWKGARGDAHKHLAEQCAHEECVECRGWKGTRAALVAHVRDACPAVVTASGKLAASPSRAVRDALNPPLSRWLVLDVRGTRFEVAVDVFLRCNPLLADLVTRHLEQDATEPLVLDVDPIAFAEVLCWLRTGVVVCCDLETESSTMELARTLEIEELLQCLKSRQLQRAEVQRQHLSLVPRPESCRGWQEFIQALDDVAVQAGNYSLADRDNAFATLKALLSHQLVAHTDELGNTPLHLICSYQPKSCMQLSVYVLLARELLTPYVPLHALNAAGNTPCDLAAENIYMQHPRALFRFVGLSGAAIRNQPKEHSGTLGRSCCNEPYSRSDGDGCTLMSYHPAALSCGVYPCCFNNVASNGCCSRRIHPSSTFLYSCCQLPDSAPYCGVPKCAACVM